MPDRFDRAGKVAETYDKLRAVLADSLSLHDRDGRIDGVANAVFEMVEAIVAADKDRG